SPSPSHHHSRRDRRTPFLMYLDAQALKPPKIKMRIAGNPPQDIADNFDYHRQLGFFDVHVYDRQRAEAFLYDYYGREAKSTFVSLRHPAEEADFLRPHLIYAYGGHYLGADVPGACLVRVARGVRADGRRPRAQRLFLRRARVAGDVERHPDDPAQLQPLPRPVDRPED